MKKYFFMLLVMVALQANAQFSYSVKAGWSKPNIHNDESVEYKSSFTLGVSVDYDINGYFGVQSGLNYKRIYYAQHYGTVESPEEVMDKAHYIELPLLLTASAIPTPKRWRAIWNAGMFMDIPIDDGEYKSQTYYGLMAALQIEVLSHYFIRGEYQWALSSDKKGEWSKDRRTNMFSVCLGYRF